MCEKEDKERIEGNDIIITHTAVGDEDFITLEYFDENNEKHTAITIEKTLWVLDTELQLKIIKSVMRIYG